MCILNILNAITKMTIKEPQRFGFEIGFTKENRYYTIKK